MFELIDITVKGTTLEFNRNMPKNLLEERNWINPTNLTGDNMDVQFSMQETFGPSAGAMPFETNNELLELAKDTQFRPSYNIFKNNHGRIQKYTKKLEFNDVQINCVIYAIYFHFGQSRNISIRHYSSHLVLEGYLVKKHILKQHLNYE